MSVTQIRIARLDEFERRAGTGHSATDVKHLVAECRRYRAFLEALADELAAQEFSGFAAKIREAARAPGE